MDAKTLATTRSISETREQRPEETKPALAGTRDT